MPLQKSNECSFLSSGVHEASTSWADSEMGLEMRDLYSPTYLVPPGLIVHMRHITSGAPVAEVRRCMTLKARCYFVTCEISSASNTKMDKILIEDT